MLATRVRVAFEALYGRTPRLYSAPGRVNLIGEFTDYNDGFVLPMAIDRRAVVAVAPRSDRRVRVHSVTLNQGAEVDLDAPPRRLRGTWVDYVEGIARELEQEGAPLVGADLVVDGDVPLGGGLSSSAALEISVALALLGAAGRALPPGELARAAQRAEHEYVGAKCGIMDPLVSAAGVAGHALLIDCRSLAAVPVPLDKVEATVLVCDTRVKHDNASSAYNERRDECARAVEALQRLLPDVRALRDVEADAFDRVAAQVPEPARRRARHVVTENARTQAAADAMIAGSTRRLGELMFASHASLRDDFEVTVPELDVLVDRARPLEGVYGARMTGGGFGGCAIVLVAPNAATEVARALSSAFSEAFGREPGVFEARASGGGREIV